MFISCIPGKLRMNSWQPAISLPYNHIASFLKGEITTVSRRSKITATWPYFQVETLGCLSVLQLVAVQKVVSARLVAF